jgi:hypothetical protein
MPSDQQMGRRHGVRIQMLLGEEEEDGERTDDVEWGAFGFIFATDQPSSIGVGR